MPTKARSCGRTKPRTRDEWGELESVPQIGPSLHLGEDGDPAPPPYRRYLPDPEKKPKKARKK